MLSEDKAITDGIVLNMKTATVRKYLLRLSLHELVIIDFTYGGINQYFSRV